MNWHSHFVHGTAALAVVFALVVWLVVRTLSR
jgi:hypothetical protein